MISYDIWKKKAVAFVTRSHRHLWGKNNEEPLAFLFLNGLENQSAKDMMIGWNKFGQERPKEKWGLVSHLNEKFLLPSGIVIPYITNKELISVFIIPMLETRFNKISVIPGSQSMIMVLNDINNQNQSIVIVRNIMDGLYLYQETKNTTSIIICPNLDAGSDTGYKMIDDSIKNLLLKAKTIRYFSYIKDKPDNLKMILKTFLNISYHSYQSKEELIENVKQSLD